jgi:hypothetical protein
LNKIELSTTFIALDSGDTSEFFSVIVSKGGKELADDIKGQILLLLFRLLESRAGTKVERGKKDLQKYIYIYLHCKTIEPTSSSWF